MYDVDSFTDLRTDLNLWISRTLAPTYRSNCRKQSGKRGTIVRTVPCKLKTEGRGYDTKRAMSVRLIVD